MRPWDLAQDRRRTVGKRFSLLPAAEMVLLVLFSLPQPVSAGTDSAQLSSAEAPDVVANVVPDATGSPRSDSVLPSRIDNPLPDQGRKVHVQESYGNLPLYFIRNNGQVDAKAKYYEKGNGHATYFTKDGVYLTLTRNNTNNNKDDKSTQPLSLNPSPLMRKESSSIPSPLAGVVPGGGKEGADITSELVKLTFLDANPNPEIIAIDPQEGKVNYFIGNDPKKWRTNIPTYRAVLYKEVYPGIDIKFYGINRQLEYDIIVKPGADPSKVKLAYDGIEGLRVTEEGDIEISLHSQPPAHIPPFIKGGQGGEDKVEGEGNKLTLKKPIIYQEIDGKRIAVEGRFKILENDVIASEAKPSPSLPENRQFAHTFELASYDKSHSLVIDPVLVYSTYLGGSDYDFGWGIAVDGSGNAYVTGTTGSTNFPTTPGAYDTTFNGGYDDVFVAKLNGSGTALVYSTYLGGSDYEESRGIAVDGSGNAYVTGTTGSTDFPVTPGAYDTTQNGSYDGFVAKLNGNGTALVYATYLGGSSDEYGAGIAVDGSGNAYLTGGTSSADFPATPGAYDTTFNGDYDDVFVAKLDGNGTALVYASYLGGSSHDGAGGIAVDGSGNAYLTGGTSSTDFPATPGAYDTTQNGSYDGFVAKLNGSGTALVYASYLGGSGDDWGSGIGVNGSSNAYVMGETSSTDFPATPGAYDTTFNGGYDDVFVAKLNGSGTALVYATYLGGSGDDGESGDAGRSGIAVDGSGNAYVTGLTSSSNFPTTPGAYDTTFNGGYDVFVVKLDGIGSALDYATYLGGSSDEYGSGIAVDGSGNAYYVTGGTNSTNFPATPGAYDTTQNGSFDVFVAKISIPLDFAVSQAPSGDQRFPWADYNETTGEHLVLWQDKRNGAFDDIYGVRVDVNGSRIGSDFAVSTAAGHQQRVLVKSGGGGYLALWHDLRNQATQGADIYGAWIDGDGTVGMEMAICSCPSDQWNPVAGYDPFSDSFLVVWLDGRGSTNNQTGNPNDNYDLYGVVIPAGGSGSLTPFPLISANNGQRGPQIGYDYENEQYYLAWNDRRGSDYDIYGARVATSGVSLDGTGNLLIGAVGNQFRPTVTDRRPANGINNHFLAWTDYRNGTKADVYGAYVDGNGIVVGSDIAICSDPGDEANVVADVDWINTKKNVVSWIRQQDPQTYFNVVTGTVDQAGTVTCGGPLNPVAAEQRANVVTYATDGVNDYGFLEVSADRRNGTDYDIWGMKVWP